MPVAVPIDVPTPKLPDYQTLLRPLSRWNPKRWYFASIKAALRTVGRASEGISIGLKNGFDSGVMLEHVYRNVARGRNAFGRLIDRVYLSAPGWRGIRERGALLQDALGREIDSIAASGRAVRMLDVACGGGRYDLEVLAAKPNVSATLRDYRDENIASARALARDLGVAATFEQADAFSDADLARAGAPNMIIVSGLHEIISDNALVERHFAQLAAIAERPATLIFTIQPWHPQLEFIARVLTSHTGAPWVMRLRPWRQTRAWAEAAGFRIRSLTKDRQGIFGVVVADLA
jgi:2-polyprenyl-3-methyl-5-hydroxy-6-metoxy-1,4-benzoquinol methylase